MYESISIVGERGQITIPKIIRDIEGIKERDKLLIKIENNIIVIEKILAKKEKEEQIAEGYKKLAKLNTEISEEMSRSGNDAEVGLDEY